MKWQGRNSISKSNWFLWNKKNLHIPWVCRFFLWKWKWTRPAGVRVQRVQKVQKVQRVVVGGFAASMNKTITTALADEEG